MQKSFAYGIMLPVVDLVKAHIFLTQKKGGIDNCKIRIETAMTAYSCLIFILFWAGVSCCWEENEFRQVLYLLITV